MVVMKELNFIGFHFRTSVVVLQELISNQFLLWDGHGGPEGTDLLAVSTVGMVWWSLKELIFNSFYLREGVVVLKELNFIGFHFRRVWWSCKN